MKDEQEFISRLVWWEEVSTRPWVAALPTPGLPFCCWGLLVGGLAAETGGGTTGCCPCPDDQKGKTILATRMET